MRLKTPQLNWPMDANEAYGLSGTGEGAVGDCRHLIMSPFRLFMTLLHGGYLTLVISKLPLRWHYRIDYIRRKKVYLNIIIYFWVGRNILVSLETAEDIRRCPLVGGQLWAKRIR